MADLAPAWIGLGGVTVGAAITQVADEIRWRRERRERFRERRLSVVIQILHHASDAVGLSGDLSDTATLLARLLGTVDSGAVDEALRLLNRSVDELRALGPTTVIEPAIDYEMALLDLRDSARGGATAERLTALAKRTYEAKTTFLAAATSAALTA